MQATYGQWGRRAFLKFAITAPVAALPLTALDSESAKPLNGLFPIGQTPFTADNKLDLECLAAEVKFLNRGRVHGFVWPQIASGWTTLSETERMEGAEAIVDAGRSGSTAIVIGVQDKSGSVQQAAKYAVHAAKSGADAIISLPPPGISEAGAIIEYYRTLGAATQLPLFVQTIGDFSIDSIIEMFKTIPTMKVVKDEAGDPLARVRTIRERTADKLAIFSGKGVRTMIEEMELGFVGHCPTTGLADLYQAAWDRWQEGKRAEAFDMFGRVLAFNSIPGSENYVLVARGVFKESTTYRPTPGMGNEHAPKLDNAGRKLIHEALSTYLKPYLKG